MVKIHYITFSLGYVEESSLGTYFFGHPEGFDTVYDAVKDLTYWLLEFFKKDAESNFYCFRKEYNSKKNPCPLKHPRYPYKYCHDCGRKSPLTFNPSHEEFIISITKEIMEGTAESWSSFYNLEMNGCLWDCFVDFSQMIKSEPEHIANFSENPFPLFLLTVSGDELGDVFKKDTEENKKIKHFIDSNEDYNDENNKSHLICEFERYRLDKQSISD